LVATSLSVSTWPLGQWTSARSAFEAGPGRAHAEVQPQVALRDVAAAAPDLVDLRVAASHHADARPDFEKIAVAPASQQPTRIR